MRTALRAAQELGGHMGIDQELTIVRPTPGMLAPPGVPVKAKIGASGAFLDRPELVPFKVSS